MKEISAGGVVFRKRKEQTEILLIKDRFGKYTLPKGKKEADETDTQTALREIQEETGITGKIVQKLNKIHYSYNHSEYGKVNKEVSYFLVEAIQGEETPQLSEIQGVSWYSPQIAWELFWNHGYQNNRIVLELAYQALGLEKGETEMNQIAAMIDHTLLKPEATKEQIVKLCEEAKTHHFASVCINPYWVQEAAELLKGTDVKVCTVIGFPLGATLTEVKMFETKKAVQNGATEIDMVLNIGALKSGNLEDVKRDIAAVVEAASGHIVKVILETGLLTDEEIVQASRLSKEAGAHFVKTSTGFLAGGATIHAVELMRQAVGEEMGVKASGGVRDLNTVQQMIQVGATRIGTSSGVAIVTGKKGTSSY
ncbi:deoxyribose-phosphate aldolase [Thermoflavimicrobium daqui]|uniref:Deoxyribose-phosphate aldolase n=2 Tax=Thermoflavimicrobium daqui TaxID=2137476 RepID=A0A364K6E3_9BACL|nr:deoxyribose-phosphate aldolase [Thermoflavimicrobium daqui]